MPVAPLMRGHSRWIRDFRLLVAADARRFAAVFRRPRAAPLLAAAGPLVLLGAAMLFAGDAARPDLVSAGGAAVWGFILSAPVAFFSYDILFRPADGPLLRRVGLEPYALFAHRALRLGFFCAAALLVALLPMISVPAQLPLATVVGIPIVAAAWGAALLSSAAAALAVAPVDGARTPGFFSRMMQYDRDLVDVAPLFYAPLAPLAAAIFAAVFVALDPGFVRFVLPLGFALAAAALAASPFAKALPRFAAKAGEMAFVPPPAATAGGLAPRRGVARLLPVAVASAWARDRLVIERRHRWALTLVWPVAIIGGFAIARLGGRPEIRQLVMLAGGTLLLAQAGAVLALGRAERAGPRWLDRAVGLGAARRWLARLALGIGLSLWLTVPFSLTWSWWTPAPGWLWLAAGGATAAVGAASSLLAAGR